MNKIEPAKRMEKAEFTNMCMVYDDKGNVLVQKRVKGWCGLAFPGGGRYIVYLYKTNEFEGKLSFNDEGRNFWMPLDELKERKSEMSDNFEYMLEVFTKDELSEHYHRRHNENTVEDIVK